MIDTDINSRKLAILSCIAKGYLRTGEPIGSKTLVTELSNAVSSATIRNDMADLERKGLLYQPHTSAGRIPTAAGLQLYISRLMEKRHLSGEKRAVIDSILSSSYNLEDAISSASGVLAEYSKCASFSTAPVSGNTAIRQIDLIKTGRRSIVFVIITATGIVKSSAVCFPDDISQSDFEMLSERVRSLITGKLLSDITPAFIQTLAAQFPEHSLLFSPFFSALIQTVEKLCEPQLNIKGQDNLLSAGFHSLDAADALQMLYSDSFYSMIMPQFSGDINIVMPDSGNKIRFAAVVYSSFGFSGGLLGTIGVLGPSRLDYSSIIPMIEYFSASLENMIKNKEFDK